MDQTSIDRIAKRFAERRLTRRRALIRAGAGLAAGAAGLAGSAAPLEAQQATPATGNGTAETKTEFLFVQSFAGGSIGPKTGSTDTFELTLEQGLGQTIFFSNRPKRIVGAGPTEQVLKGLNFSPDNPPNAALVMEAVPGDEDIAVVELTNPRYDTATNTATYEAKPLKDFETSLEMGFQEQPTDLGKLHATFGAAHLLIDDCPDGTVTCVSNYNPAPCPNGNVCGQFGPMGLCWSWSNLFCYPCEPYDHQNPTAQMVYKYWTDKCNNTFPSCQEGGRQSYGCFSHLPGTI